MGNTSSTLEVYQATDPATWMGVITKNKNEQATEAEQQGLNTEDTYMHRVSSMIKCTRCLHYFTHTIFCILAFLLWNYIERGSDRSLTMVQEMPIIRLYAQGWIALVP